MTNLVYGQISYSTADDERNYFSGERQNIPNYEDCSSMPEGEYRVIDGEVFRIGDGFPPSEPQR